MYLGEGNFDPSLTLALPFLSTSLVVPAATTSMAQSSPDPNVEVEVLNNMAHLTMDVCTFFVQDTCVCRVLEVFGRVLAMSADYAPDHAILGDEFVFQMIMLGIAMKGLVSSLLPKAAAIFAVTSQKDIRAYLSLFRKTGLTWMQYRTLKALAFEWVDVHPGQIITSDEKSFVDQNIYYLYSGEVNVESEGKHLHSINQECMAPRLNDVQSMTLFGELRFVCRLYNSYHGISSLSYAKTTTKVGPKGATLLRVDTSKLTMLMDNDANLAQSIRCLLMNGMQDKLLSVLCTTKSNQLENAKI
mmetsp:Transcript_1390/g.1943  ORF Transcript_1390/g.1943 Transcript_1390/m.1943 type:complete len:301 (-) Transcript_1390:245-1147(-)